MNNKTKWNMLGTKFNERSLRLASKSIWALGYIKILSKYTKPLEGHICRMFNHDLAGMMPWQKPVDYILPLNLPLKIQSPFEDSTSLWKYRCISSEVLMAIKGKYNTYCSYHVWGNIYKRTSGFKMQGS